jgi:molybdopterin converting factor small subunit
LKVNARLHATLRRATPDGPQNRVTVELEEGATVASLLSFLEIDMAPAYLLVIINKRRVEPDYLLSDGDEIDLFPPISGGRNSDILVCQGEL